MEEGGLYSYILTADFMYCISVHWKRFLWNNSFLFKWYWSL